MKCLIMCCTVLYGSLYIDQVEDRLKVNSDLVNNNYMLIMGWVHSGYGGSYFSPPWLWVLAINLDHAGMREPGNGLVRDEAAMTRLYERTLDIVNKKLAEKNLGKIEAASPKVLAQA